MNRLELHDRLMMLLLKNELSESDKLEVEKCIADVSMNWEMFLGKVCFNRVNGMIHKNMREFRSIPREVKMTLDMMYNGQIEKLEEQKKTINEISEIFAANNIKHAFLKGSVLNTIIYPEGTRISNDTDILISPSQIGEVEKLLSSIGFIQGTYNKVTDTIEKASMKKKMYMRMNTHEVQSFSRKEDSRFLRINTIDVNFKLSVNDDISVTDKLLENVMELKKNGVHLCTLEWDYFYVQLASHLYREARLATKIISGSDMHAYKFYDFYMILTSDMITFDFDNIKKIAKETNQMEAVYYSLYAINQLFEGTVDEAILKKFEFDDYSFIDEYISRQDDVEKFFWNKPFIERFFDYTRRLDIDQNVNKASKDFQKNVFSV